MSPARAGLEPPRQLQNPLTPPVWTDALSGRESESTQRLVFGVVLRSQRCMERFDGHAEPKVALPYNRRVLQIANSRADLEPRQLGVFRSARLPRIPRVVPQAHSRNPRHKEKW